MDTNELVSQLRSVGSDLQSVEVKAAVGGFPTSILETLSAFSNASGGVVLLGLDEDRGFTAASGFDALRIRDALAGACSDRMWPRLRIGIGVEEFEGATIVRADVPELDPIEKPCYVESKGAYQGSYIRSGDGDRQLTHYEVTQLLSNRSQPTHDAHAVDGAEIDYLDPELVDSLIALAKRRTPRAFQGHDDTDVLAKLGALNRTDRRPTVAGLMALGKYPQEFFPQLFVSFVAYPGTRKGETGPAGERFVDNESITGPIPAMISDVVAALTRNMRKAAVVRGLYREDRYDYPLDVIRELIVNALMHRDYSPDGRGAQVQVELYADRLVIRSPGGLYGAISIDQLGTDNAISSSRNQHLAILLSDLPLPDARGEAICENRGSGITQVFQSLRNAGMSPPTFDAAPGSLTVTVPEHALLSPDTIEWIGSLGEPTLSDHQHLALAMMRNTGMTTNPMLQAWGIDQLAAGQALKGLLALGFAVRSGGRRYASYRLTGAARNVDPTTLSPRKVGPGAGTQSQREAIVQAIRAGHDTVRALTEVLGLNRRSVDRRLGELVKSGHVERTHPTGDRRQTYRLTHEDTP